MKEIIKERTKDVKARINYFSSFKSLSKCDGKANALKKPQGEEMEVLQNKPQGNSIFYVYTYNLPLIIHFVIFLLSRRFNVIIRAVSEPSQS